MSASKASTEKVDFQLTGRRISRSDYLSEIFEEFPRPLVLLSGFAQQL